MVKKEVFEWIKFDVKVKVEKVAGAKQFVMLAA